MVELSVLAGVMRHSTKESRPEELLTGVWVAMVTRVVEIVDVFNESRNVARFVEDGNEHVLLAVCSGGWERGGWGRMDEWGRGKGRGRKEEGGRVDG